MPEHVRVTDLETGHQYTITRAKYEVNPSLYRELKQDATDPAGFPLPPVYKSSDAAPASAKQAGSSANTEKENS